MTTQAPSVLLTGPYDPHCREYTFPGPPPGVWRPAEVLAARPDWFDSCATGRALRPAASFPSADSARA